MKKVTGIIGSLRKGSIHRTLFNHYKNLCSDQFELVEGEFHDMPLYNQDIEKEPESVVKLAELIKSSEGVLFFSPEYNYSIPGGLKNALDWLSRSDLKPFDAKKAAIIGASPGSIGTARMQYHLRQVGVFLNIRFMNRPEVMIGNAFEKINDAEITDQNTVDFLSKHSSLFLNYLSQ